MSIDVTHLQAGDYVEAEFRELARPHFVDGWPTSPRPTGRTYILKGELMEYEAYPDPSQKGLSMPNGMVVRQATGDPGGWLVSVISHKHKGDSE